MIMILNVIIAVVLLEYLTNSIIGYLNINHELKPIPEILKRNFTYIQRKKMYLYHKANFMVGGVNQFFSLIIILSLLFYGGFGYFDHLVWSYTDSQIIASLLFFGIVGIGAYLLSLPWDVYHTFYIENKFGFNRSSIKTYFWDQIKSLLLSFIVGGGLLLVITWIYTNMPNSFWWVAWIVMTVFSLFMMLFYSNIIVPLFNKQVPLEEGSLRQKIEEIGGKVGFQIKDIYVIDGSKRSSKSNAYFTGFGPKKRIVLYDTLIEALSEEEIIAVLAHEIGHYKKKHTLRNLISGIVQTGVVLFVFHAISHYTEIYEVVGAKQPSFHIALLVFGFLFQPVSTVIGLLMNFFSRKFEYQADSFAVHMGYGQQLKSALVQLSKENLSNLNPHPANVFMNYSHPPLKERITHINKQ